MSEQTPPDPGATGPSPPIDQRILRVDGAVGWIEETVIEPDRSRPRPNRQSSVLGAAMIAVGEIIEPDKTQVDIEAQAEAQSEEPYDLPFTVDFGDLPDLGMGSQPDTESHRRSDDDA